MIYISLYLTHALTRSETQGTWWILQGPSLQWRHNGHDSVSNHQPHDCLLNRLFRRRSKKTSKLHGTGLCVQNSPGTGEFPTQMASNMENASIWWCHHVNQMIVLFWHHINTQILMSFWTMVLRGTCKLIRCDWLSLVNHQIKFTESSPMVLDVSPMQTSMLPGDNKSVSLTTFLFPWSESTTSFVNVKKIHQLLGFEVTLDIDKHS